MTRAPINDRQGRCEEPAEEGVLLALAERVEKGRDGEQHQWLAQAFYAANPAPEYGTADRSEWVARSDRFHTLLAARAYLDAAMSLVPRGEDWSLSKERLSWVADFTCFPPDDYEKALESGLYVRAATPALALCAAALRARAQSGAAS